MRDFAEEKEVGSMSLRDVIRPGASRGLEFVTLEDLIKRTGVGPKDALRFTLSEMLCNALDKEDAGLIKIELQVEGEFYRLTISDNGRRKLKNEEEVKLIFDFENKASSKRGILAVSRGYLGNALKCILGFVYSLAERRGLKPPPVIVRSGKREYTVTVKVDRIREKAEPEVRFREVEDDGFTAFTVKLPRDLGEDIESLEEVIRAASIVNPWRRITYNILGKKGTVGSVDNTRRIKKETFIQLYASDSFRTLFKDYRKAAPNAKFGEFISIFKDSPVETSSSKSSRSSTNFSIVSFRPSFWV